MKIALSTLLTFVLAFTQFCLNGQTPTCTVNSFQKTYGISNFRQQVQDVVETPDHGFIIGGWGGSYGDSCLLMKIDEKGAVVWAHQLLGNNTPTGFVKKLLKLKDGNYIAVARGYSPDFLDTWIIKFDENGNIIWNKEMTYPTGISTDPLDACETADGGFAIAASFTPYANAGGSLIIKLNSIGDFVWSKSCLGSIITPNYAGISGITEINGILFLAGRDNGANSGLILEMRSSDGGILQQTSIQVDNKNTTFYSIEHKNNKFFIDGFIANNLGNNNVTQAVLILDENLNVLKAYKVDLGFNNSWGIPGMFATNDDGFIAEESEENNADLVLVGVSYDGNIKWKRQYQRPGDQVTFNIKATSDNGIIGVGASNDLGVYWNFKNEIFVYKTDSTGLTPFCTSVDPYAAVLSLPFSTSQPSFIFNSMTFPMIVVNSLKVPIPLPIKTFCENSFTRNCSSVKITGEDTICNLSSTAVFKVLRNNNCNAALRWDLDTSFTKILSATDSTITIQFKKEGTTRLLCSIADPCETASDSITVHIFNSPVAINLGPDSRICENDSTTLHAGKSFKHYVWQDGTTDSNLVVHSPGDYHVTAINYCNETFTGSIKISFATDPKHFLNQDTSVCEGQLIKLSSLSTFNNYLWSTGETTGQIQISSAGIYWLQVVNNDGCFAKEYINVKSKDNCAVALYFPGAFTPNKDGLNDQFKGTAYGLLTKFHLTVYNRYGNIVFETRDISKGWDGKYKGIEQDPDGFVWYCEYQFYNSALQTKKGTLVLIR